MKADLIKKVTEQQRKDVKMQTGKSADRQAAGRSTGNRHEEGRSTGISQEKMEESWNVSGSLEKMPESGRGSWSLQEKLQWEQSEALQHMHSTDSIEQKSHMTGLDQSREKADSPQQMRELFKAENSYGSVAVGVNKKHEAAVTVSEKREHNGHTVQENQKNVRMERKKREISPFGNTYMNPDKKQDGAMAFQARTELPLAKMLEQIGRQHEKSDSAMLEKRMPFLRRERERMKVRTLEQKQRDRQEAGETVQAQQMGHQIEKIRSRMWKQEQEEKQMRKKLQEAWKRAGEEAADDFEVRHRGRKADQQEQEEGADKDEGEDMNQTDAG